jgi:hypothetical protein
MTHTDEGQGPVVVEVPLRGRHHRELTGATTPPPSPDTQPRSGSGRHRRSDDN